MAEERLIVLVSDDRDIQDEISFGLPEGYQLISVVDSRHIASKLDGRRPDLVIAEIRSGSAGGFSLGKELSQARFLKDVPIYMLLERSQDEWLAKQGGADKTRVQPVEASELINDALSLIAS